MKVIPLEYLTVYIWHVAQGRTLAQVANLAGIGHRSTILRRIRSVEEARDHPEWSDLLDDLERFRNSPDCNVSPDAPVDRDQILRALGITASEISADIGGLVNILRQSRATVIVGAGLPSAGVLIEGEVIKTFKRSLLQAGICFGWFSPDQSSAGKLRKFKVAKTVMDAVGFETTAQTREKTAKVSAPRSATTGRALSMSEMAINRLVLRRDHPSQLSDKHLQWARDVQTAMLVGGTAVEGIRKVLGDRSYEILERHCLGIEGFERIEEEMGLTQRSAKVVLLLLLETLAHCGIFDRMAVIK
ncbi:hypothetical protein J7443_17495 [Tropicibacter sp. R15_0]|uniref:DUF6456 domain-containing protein n=1 Tax=Tropicibacter sp. R15_0 TaxID=2821101 RepID=UPI001ADC1688|nr:DUF6456 domain-containing protein [Tropicibacter sp. R15_0]MBO9467042.1 hypothetical protein [Tropicibacter sp. R15_0]